MSEQTVEPAAVKRLERSRDDRMVAGVCGGLARYFDMHPAFYRVGFVVLTLIGGAGVLIYLAAWLVIPDHGREDSIAESVLRARRDRPWPLIGLGLIGLAGIVLLSRASIHTNWGGWFLLLLAGLAILWITLRQPRESRDGSSVAEGASAAAEPSVLAAEDARRMRRVGRAIAIFVGSLVALVLIATAIAVAAVPIHPGRGIGDRTYAPATVADLHRSYTLGIGRLRLDLSNVNLPRGETHVRTRLDAGHLEVIVPANAALQAHVEAHYGQVKLLGNSSDGYDTDKTVGQAGARVLVLDGHVGAGEIEVSRAVR
jgi:phage shock protein PspC (stress-responsive transcriptional regulator)